MYTYQDFLTDAQTDLYKAINTVITQHTATKTYREALTADKYDAHQNETIVNFVKKIYSASGMSTTDTMSSNFRMCSNFFNRLNTQRATYSLGNGLIMDAAEKEKLGVKFDNVLYSAAYHALIHGVSFLYWAGDRAYEFPVTQFAPLYDEETGAIRAGVRFWQLDEGKPMIAYLYEEDGYTKFIKPKTGKVFEIAEEKRRYITITEQAPADAEAVVVAEENYATIPIIPVYGSKLQQSTLVGMRDKIDAFDLIQSGFANDMNDCSEIYWLISGAGAMNDKQLAQFLDRLKLTHIASVPYSTDAQVQGYTQDIPYEARTTLLKDLRGSIYEDFGAVDVHTIAAGATNDHIDAAYQPMDENADDFEFQILNACEQLFALAGVEGVVPSFKRNRISNLAETTDMVLKCANTLSRETIVKKLPFLSSDEVDEELGLIAAEDIKRLNLGE